ncbi:MAG: YihY family inner membrane protein [Deltaproteobacteria bacterium]|jgi:membrane protein|nr:YihY family inner membrane protein [Deltaproteobacteria bacterium]MCK5010048.1 YihY family inner membrane protein [Deltaproteobacteria bacterium]MCK5513801.1 YihY family inner membrane protein [Deltaproteobacteria bacterium]
MKKPNRYFILPLSTSFFNTTQWVSLSIKDFYRNRCILWAAALTYTTVFALIPLLAVTFSLFHAFGGLKELEEKIRPLILKVMVPGAQEKLIATIDSLIERLNAGAIGAVGTVLVFLSAIFLIGQLEMILNEIWGLKKHRPFFYRLALYWTAITVGPPLLALSIGIPATLSSYQAVSWLENYINLDFFTFLPYILIWCAFTGLYTFMPNTKVRFLPAAIGGIMGGTIWQIAGIGFTLYTSRILVYSKIYGSLGLIPLFFLWLFISWSIFLLGAELSFTFQNFQLLRNGLKVHSPSYKEREYLSLRILIAVGKNFLAKKNPLTFKGIAKQLNLPPNLTKELISSLLDSNLLIELDGYEQEAYIPGRSLDAIRMSDVICTVQGNQRLSTESEEDKIILELLTSGEKKLEECSGNKNLREILDDLERLEKQKTD